MLIGILVLLMVKSLSIEMIQDRAKIAYHAHNVKETDSSSFNDLKIKEEGKI